MANKKTSKLPVAVIDNTLLSRLTRLDIVEFLPLIFQKILIPPEVRKEAFRHKNKRRLRNVLNEMSDFFILCKEDDIFVKEFLKTLLHEGEAAVIAQAEFTNSAVIVDERKGSKQATQRELTVYPTTSIICLLKAAGAILEVRPYLDKLIKLGFHLSPKLYKEILKQEGESE